eukprot:3119807-Pyramimonas_sp.AAC.1
MAHEDWHKWEPPTNEDQLPQYRKSARERINTLAKLAVANAQAAKSDEAERAEIGMILYALSTLKPLGHQLADARTRSMEYENQLKETRQKIQQLED